MDHIPPFGADPETPYVDDDEALEIDGSIPPAKFFNDILAELLAVLTAAGIEPDSEDLTQIAQAIQALIIEGGRVVKATEVTFADGVGDGEAVLWDAAESEYAKALADGTTANQGIGFADVTNSEVIFFGLTRTGLFSGLTPGARQYLSGDTAGAITETPPDDRVRMGIAISATQMFVDVDTGDAPVESVTEADYGTLADSETLTFDVGPGYLGKAAITDTPSATVTIAPDATNLGDQRVLLTNGSGGGYALDVAAWDDVKGSFDGAAGVMHSLVGQHHDGFTMLEIKRVST